MSKKYNNPMLLVAMLCTFLGFILIMVSDLYLFGDVQTIVTSVIVVFIIMMYAMSW